MLILGWTHLRRDTSCITTRDMETRYYRISPQPLADADMHGDHVSRLWVDCGDSDTERRGLSCCASYSDLLSYFAGRAGEHSLGRGATFEGAVLTVVEGERSDDDAWEECYGEVLVHPTRIVSQEPVIERFIRDLCAHVAADRQLHAVEYDADRDELVGYDRCDGCDGTGHDEDECDGECVWCDGTGRTRR